MQPPFRLVTLGTLRIDGNDWRPAKALALLTYLSLEGPTSRRRLRELFWPQAQNAGASLRVVLGQVRSHLPGVVRGEETLEVDLVSDAAHLLGLEERRGDAADAETYGGPFLAAVQLNEVSDELEEWVLDTRERLAGAARLAMLRAAELAGSPAEAAHWAERAAAITHSLPPEPELLERMLRLTLPGSRLEAELRRDLSEFTHSTSQTSLPMPEQELLGREHELSGLLLALSDPVVRLLEITGPGGIGKSTLAAALLREQADLSGVQVLSVALESALASSEAAARMVVALKLQVTDLGDGWLALARAWGERPLLALLDGVEGLPELGNGIATLLGTCPGVRLVITSRVQRLTGGASGAGLGNFEGAVHLALDGLSVPAPGESPARVARCAAVQLFVRGARRYLPRFAADEQNAPLVSAIVRRLDGHPLATVLSATWMRVYPPAQIHTLILQDLAALRAENGSRERHQLSAVFERSWQLLTPEEAQAVSALAVFQGFTPDAALSVAGVTPTLLGSLTAHSLLRALPGGRLEVPPVLAAQAQAHLPDAAAVQDAHAGFYLEHLMGHTPESDEVDTERANIVAATAHSLSRGRDMSRQIDTLLASYDRRGLLDSGTDAFYMLKEILAVQESASEGSVLVGLAWLANQSARRIDAENIVLSILTRIDVFNETVQMKATNIMAISLMYRGKTAESIAYYEQAADLARRLGDLNRQVMYSLNISVTRCHVGEYEKAMQGIQTILDNHMSIMPRDLKMQIECQIIEIQYSSSSLVFNLMNELFNRYLITYIDQKKTRAYMVTQCLYIAFLMDNGKLDHAMNLVKELTLVLNTTQRPYILLAKQIAESRLLYLRGKSKGARQLALYSLDEATRIGDEDGMCEIILACSPNILEHDTELGTELLRLAITDLSHSEFQKRRALKLLAGHKFNKSLTNTDARETLERLRSSLGSVFKTA